MKIIRHNQKPCKTFRELKFGEGFSLFDNTPLGNGIFLKFEDPYRRLNAVSLQTGLTYRFTGETEIIVLNLEVHTKPPIE